MPRRRVPRTFALDPAVYGKPTPQPLFRLYPALQAATVLAALMLMFLVGLEAFGGAAQQATSEASVAMVEKSAETTSDITAQNAAPAEAELTVAESAAEEAPAEEAVAASAVADAQTADEAAPEEPVQGFAAPAAESEAVPTVASVPREGEAAAELRAAPAEGQLTQSTEAYAATVEAPQAAETAVNPEPTLSPLRGLQIGLALTFVILLILTLLVRQRVR